MRMIERRRSLAALLVAILGTACGRDGLPPAADVSLTAIDSVQLEEDSLPLGAIAGFAVGPSGEYFLSDRQHGAVFVFSASGRLQKLIGRRGEGPGEWAFGPFTILPIGTSTLLVSDGPALRGLSLTGEVQWSRPQTPGSTLLAATDQWVISQRIDRDTRHTISRTDTTGTAQSGGPFPQQLGRSRVVDQFLVAADAVMLSADSVAVVTQGSDHLFVGAFAGPHDSIPMPATRRRGAMQALLAAVNDSVPSTMEAAAYQASFPLEVAALAPGWVAVVMLDQTFLGDRMVGPLFLTVVDLNTRGVCSDIAIPGSTDPHSRVAFRGDTLLVLSQDVDSAATSSRTMVRRYRVGRRVCE